MIEFHHVTKQFKGKRRVTALDDVSLVIPRGEMVSIIGPSGSGKSSRSRLTAAWRDRSSLARHPRSTPTGVSRSRPPFARTATGVYARAEYSQARGHHWRATVTGAAIAGHSDDFLGQYHRNSHVAAALRYSF